MVEHVRRRAFQSRVNQLCDQVSAGRGPRPASISRSRARYVAMPFSPSAGLRRHLRAVDAALTGHLDTDQRLLVAGTDRRISLFRQDAV